MLQNILVCDQAQSGFLINITIHSVLLFYFVIRKFLFLLFLQFIRVQSTFVTQHLTRLHRNQNITINQKKKNIIFYDLWKRVIEIILKFM